jgi:hypothetical protein
VTAAEPASPSEAHPTTWIVDGSNVVGAGADGWWNDRAGAFARFAQVVARWANEGDDPVVLVFDGAPDPAIARAAGGDLRVEFAPRRGRDAADDRIVELVDELLAQPGWGTERRLVAVTSDKGLVARLRTPCEVEGAGTFRRRLGLGVGGGGRR